MLLKSKFAKLRAVSLVEVLVVLALVATSMVGVAGINVRAQLAVKDNETLDLGNGAMLQALELAKSPAGLELITATGGRFTGAPAGNYSIDNNNRNSLVRRADSDRPLSATAPCDSNSTYYVTPVIANRAPGSGKSPDICLQIIITAVRRPLSSDSYFEIRSTVLFELSSGPVVNQLIAYRREPFN
jgi:type II secretory pathway pseudopilin PulG